MRACVYLCMCSRVSEHLGICLKEALVVELRLLYCCQGLFFSDIGGSYACGSSGGGVTGLAGCLKV